jgi:hypothetical protein
MSPRPSRRRLLAACGAALGTTLTGCITQPSSDGARTTTNDGTTTASPTTTNRTGTDGVETYVGAHNAADEDATVTVALRRDGETLQQATETLQAGVTTTLDIVVTTPETYTVAASRGDGEETTFEWNVPESYGGSLEVRVGEDGTLGFREHLSGAGCGGEALPYAVPGNEETFTAGSGSVRNDAGEPVTVTVTIAHDGTTFFECTRDLGANQTASLGDLTETAGEYSVTVDVADGGRTEYDWRIPPEYNWPKLSVVVPASGDPLAGCGAAGSIDVTVSNPAGNQRTATLALLRDGTAVTRRQVSVAGGEESSVALDTPIGDIYTLRAEAGAGTTTAEVADCYCYSEHRTTVALGDDGPAIDSIRRVCD